MTNVHWSVRRQILAPLPYSVVDSRAVMTHAGEVMPVGLLGPLLRMVFAQIQTDKTLPPPFNR